jgi:diguanylate cyclase
MAITPKAKFQDDLSTASDILRKALPQMIRRKIPPTPQNYALWYLQTQNTDPEFGELLLKEFPGIGSYNPEKSEALFFDFFIRDYLPNNPNAQKLVIKIISQLTTNVATQLKGTGEFQTALGDALDDFKIVIDPEQIKDILTDLSKHTETVAGLNREFQKELQKANAEMVGLKAELTRTKEEANLDVLTQLGNRRAFDTYFKEIIRDYSAPVSILLLDIDLFKNINDSYGHPFGDRVLTHIGTILKEFENESQSVFRYGGEEFVGVVLKPLKETLEIAEAMRTKIGSFRIKNRSSEKQVGAITVSIGVANRGSKDTEETLLKRVDDCLYYAKQHGRNQCSTVCE